MKANAIERDRITARVPKTVKSEIEMAAELIGSKCNDFIVQAALAKAREIIDRDRIIRMSTEDSVVFFEAIDNPPKPNDRLKAARDRARKQKII